MYPGLSDADCQVATFHYRQLVGEGERQQLVMDGLPASARISVMSVSVRQQLGALLLRAGQHVQGAPVETRVGPGLRVLGTEEHGAVA